MAEDLDVLYTTTAPNGNISARQGRVALYNNGGSYEKWINVDGSTTWERVDHVDPFQTGDWIVSSVTTARTGWTNVSATYNNKFIRISSGTPLNTSGADTHTHDAGTLAGPSHTHTGPSHTHTYSGTCTVGGTYSSDGVQSNPGYGMESTRAVSAQTYSGTTDSDGTGATGAAGDGAVTGATASANNVPVYITVVVFQKD